MFFKIVNFYNQILNCPLSFININSNFIKNRFYPSQSCLICIVLIFFFKDNEKILHFFPFIGLTCSLTGQGKQCYEIMFSTWSFSDWKYIHIYIYMREWMWSRALDVRLSEWCCSVSMVWVQIPSREEQKFDSSKI